MTKVKTQEFTNSKGEKLIREKMTKAQAQELADHIKAMAPDFSRIKPSKYMRGNWQVEMTNPRGHALLVYGPADWKQRCDEQRFY